MLKRRIPESWAEKPPPPTRLGWRRSSTRNERPLAWHENCFITFVCLFPCLFVCHQWRVQGAHPARTLLRVPILSFLPTNFTTRSPLRSWCRPLPPTGNPGSVTGHNGGCLSCRGRLSVRLGFKNLYVKTKGHRERPQIL